MDELITVLGESALCAGLAPDEVERIAQAGRVEHWASGAVVMEEGADGPRVVVLLEGRVVVQKQDGSGVDHVLGEVEAGGVLGEMSLFSTGRRAATVRAVTPLKLFAIDRATFEDMIADGDPAAFKVGLSIARVLANRLDALNGRVVEMLEDAQGDTPIQEFARFRQELFTRWNF